MEGILGIKCAGRVLKFSLDRDVNNQGQREFGTKATVPVDEILTDDGITADGTASYVQCTSQCPLAVRWMVSWRYVFDVRHHPHVAAQLCALHIVSERKEPIILPEIAQEGGYAGDSSLCTDLVGLYDRARLGSTCDERGVVESVARQHNRLQDITHALVHAPHIRRKERGPAMKPQPDPPALALHCV